MRIGIDARELCGNPTGVGRHLAGLLNAWAQDPRASRHTFVLYAHRSATAPLSNVEVRLVPGSGGTVWEQVALPKAAKQDRLDVFFAPGYTAPLGWNVPTVVLVHDISFVARPEWFTWKEGLRRRLITRWSSNHAKLVLTVSEAARREILTHFGLPADRVRCIYPGVASLCEDARQAAGERSTRATGALCRIDFQPSACSRLTPSIQTDCDTPRGRATGDRGRQPHSPARRSACSRCGP